MNLCECIHGRNHFLSRLARFLPERLASNQVREPHREPSSTTGRDAESSSRAELVLCHLYRTRTRTRTNTNPNDTEANAAGRSGNARALRKQNKCGVNHEGEGHWPKFSQKLQKARHLWVARTPQKQ